MAKPTDADDKEPLYEIKAVALRVREDAEASDVYDDRGIEPEIKVILDGRQKRREEDAATVKNLVLILRDINLMIRIAAKAAEKKGVNDGEFQAGLAQAQEAYGGAVAATARAAMPLAESGIDINPDVLIGAPPRPADAPSTLDEPSRRLA